MIIVNQSQMGQTIDLPADQVIELRLPENPTTGFRWTFTSSGAPACEIVGDSFRPAGSALGAGGEHRWEIRGVRPGLCELSLAYHRGFEQAVPANSFTFYVRVTD